ncbi:MAG: phosphoribosylformylglycinamidine synthase I [Planctomycetes bacterium]|nr:phosphoribosylformylglycinamidine synthase I [Planctomycetota bacterium]
MSSTTRKPKALILRAPGINCERETFHAFELAGAAPEYVHVKRLRAQPQLVDGFDLFVAPGGFAYGDDIASGRVLANELRAAVGERLIALVERGGLVLGICNGFQMLTRLGILPRTNRGELVQEVALTHNLSDHYECRWVTLKSPRNRCVFLDEGLTLRVPAAHGEGRLQAKDEQLARILDEEGYTAFVYVDESGERTERYPANPNGSPRAIAGLTDATGRVLGLMPHPDRAYLPHHDPLWREEGLAAKPDGMVIFDAMVRTARAEAR